MIAASIVGRQTWSRIIACLLCVIFARAVAEFYHPASGFTALIGFPDAPEYEPPALRAVPHYVHPAWASYDGQFYAARALDPLVRDPAVDHYMDLAPYRARRILFSWTASLLGAGRPTWILEAFALQNVVCWFVLAWLLTRWIDLRTVRGLAIWTACLFSHGLLWSVRFSLLDGPSLLLIALAVWAAEAGRPWSSAAIAGIAGLARETNVLAALAQPVPRRPRDWARLLVVALVVLIPVAVWMDYLWSIYRSGLLRDTDQMAVPATAFAHIAHRTWRSLFAEGPQWPEVLDASLLVAVCAQAIYVVAAYRRWTQPWWRVAAGYVLLMLVLDRVLWDPHTGAITRVLLPLTVGSNVLLAQETRASRFWPWFVAANLHLLASPRVLPLW